MTTYNTLIKEHNKNKDDIVGINGQLEEQTTQVNNLNTNKMDKNTVDISVAQINKNLGKFDQTYMTEEFLQQIVGTTPINSIPSNNSITTVKYTDKSVTPSKTSFIKVSTNLFNKLTAIFGKGLNSSTGELVDNATAYTSQPIIIKPNTQYTGSGISVRRVFYDSSMTFISTAVSSSSPETFTTPSNAVFLRVVVPMAQINSLQINEGTTLLAYEDFYEKLDMSLIGEKSIQKNMLEDNAIDYSKTDFVIKSSNLFNKETRILSKGINPTTGVEIDNATADLSEFISIIPDTVYGIYNYVGRHAFYDCNKNFVSTGTTDTSGIATFTTPSNAVFLRLVMQKSYINSVQINLGNVLKEYEPFYFDFKYRNVESIPTIPSLEAKPYMFSTKNINIDYTPISVKAIDGTSGTDFNADTITSQSIYNKYDELVTKYPNYITKTLLGKDSTNTLDVYRYDFKPEKVITLNGSAYKDNPTVILTGGIHGNGENAGDKPNMICALYYFFKDVCENWKTDDVLDYLRWNINFIVVPISNPWGFDNKDRRNGRQVDLNRNFDLNWTQGVLGSNTYGGTSPFSEKESQYIRDLINANENAIFHCDFHTTGGTQTQDKMMYFDMSNNSILFNPASDLIKNLSRKWNKKGYGGLDTTIDLHGYIVDEAPAPICNSWIDRVAKIPSCTLEGFPNFTGSTLQTNSIELMTIACEETGNWILTNTKFIYDYYK